MSELLHVIKNRDEVDKVSHIKNEKLCVRRFVEHIFFRLSGEASPHSPLLPRLSVR